MNLAQRCYERELNTNMKTFQNFDIVQKIARFGVQTIRHALSISLVVVLLLLWALTEPLFQLGQQIERRKKLRTQKLVKS
jgi:hypothetical protein